MSSVDVKYYNVKFIFSLMSVLLLLPLFINKDVNYYRTFFIFLINEIIDSIFSREKNRDSYLSIWAYVNRWLGVIMCAFSFCLMSTEFFDIIKPIVDIINIALFVVALSYIFREMCYLILLTLREEKIIKNIKEDMNFKKLGGEN